MGNLRDITFLPMFQEKEMVCLFPSHLSPVVQPVQIERPKYESLEPSNLFYILFIHSTSVNMMWYKHFCYRHSSLPCCVLFMLLSFITLRNICTKICINCINRTYVVHISVRHFVIEFFPSFLSFPQSFRFR
jgi:hypothetical protein